jgi:hypothetical protein
MTCRVEVARWTTFTARCQVTGDVRGLCAWDDGNVPGVQDRCGVRPGHQRRLPMMHAMEQDRPGGR